MIKIRLLRLLKQGTKYVLFEIIWQWLGLITQIVIVGCIAEVLSAAYYRELTGNQALFYFAIIVFGILLRIIFDRLYTHASFKASVDVKRVMREEIYSKLLRLGSSYKQQVSTSQITQMMGEGVEQLEIYFGKYISQFIYALLAPITLFGVLYNVNTNVATTLLIAVPLIPIVIMVVMKLSRKLLDKYFQVYYGLGDTFLEKLHGLTTLKIYEADEQAAEEMDAESEKFRKITMKVLSMQLNSTIIMDVIVYVSAAIGIIVTIKEYMAGNLTLSGNIMFLLLAAEFFLPMRLLGSYFHIGMNGMKAADRMFDFLDIKEPPEGTDIVPGGPVDILVRDMSFRYGKEDVIKKLYMEFPAGKFISIVGQSGSGKSTIAKILSGQNRGYQGVIKFNGKELKKINEASLHEKVTVVSLESYIFPGTVRENLLLGNDERPDKKLISALMVVNLWKELEAQGGLDYELKEAGANLSGGQRQRLVFARALLKNSQVMIFDEATSNIDMESEDIIMTVIKKLAKDRGKTIILISHRLANVVDSDVIFMMQGGENIERGTHKELMSIDKEYAKLYKMQTALENLNGGGM